MPHMFLIHMSFTSETRESSEEMATSLQNLDIFRCRGLLTLENKLLMHRRSMFGPTFLFYHYLFFFIFTCSVSTASLPCH